MDPYQALSLPLQRVERRSEAAGREHRAVLDGLNSDGAGGEVKHPRIEGAGRLRGRVLR